MKSPEQGFDPEQEKSLNEIADHYLSQLDTLQEGGTVFMSLGTIGTTVPVVPEKLREVISGVVESVKSGELSEEDAKKKLWLGRAIMIVKNPEVEK